MKTFQELLERLAKDRDAAFALWMDLSEHCTSETLPGEASIALDTYYQLSTLVWQLATRHGVDVP